MSFRDIKGQDRAVTFLKSSIENNRLSHAYIFLGPSGIGKALTALNFAKALNCQSAAEDKPCDECISCRKIDSHNHPDLFLLKPEKKGSSIGIDDIRSLIKDITLKPYEAKKKVYIIDGADSMTHQASNALLKTLEEPQGDAILVLISENLRALLPTIQSRAQVVRFFPLSADETKKILIQNYKIDDTRAHILSRLSAGSIGEAMRYNEKGVFEERGGVIKRLVDDTFFDSDFDGVSREDFRVYLDIMLTWYRDVLVAKAGSRDAEAFVNVDKSDDILKESRRASFKYLDNAITQIISTAYFLEENANPKLAMGVLGANISR